MTKIYIIAGEPSGEAIGAKLIDNFKILEKNIEFKGVGGTKMIKAGLGHSLFDIKDLSIMGYLEVLFSIPKIINRLSQTLADIKKFSPDIIVTIDSPGFNFRLMKKVREELGTKIKAVHYVAPSVWAYKPERAYIVKKLYDHLIAILPFEKEYFSKINCPCTFIGHPFLENHTPNHQKDPNAVVIMPGSRIGEIKKHLKIFINAAHKLYEGNNNLTFYILTFKHFVPQISKLTSDYSYVKIIVDEEIKEKIQRTAGFAIVKSGTSAVEMMREETPCLVAYKMNYFTYHYVKRKLMIKYASLTNIILNKEVIREFIQQDCTADNIASEMQNLMNDENYRNQQILNFQKAKKLMLPNGYTPSKTAAQVVLNSAKQ